MINKLGALLTEAFLKVWHIIQPIILPIGVDSHSLALTLALTLALALTRTRTHTHTHTHSLTHTHTHAHTEAKPIIAPQPLSNLISSSNHTWPGPSPDCNPDIKFNY